MYEHNHKDFTLMQFYEALTEDISEEEKQKLEKEPFIENRVVLNPEEVLLKDQEFIKNELTEQHSRT